MGISLKQLQVDAEIREILVWPLEFDQTIHDENLGWFEVKPKAETTVIARDGTGGIFLLYGPEQYLLHITSEGAAGVIARDLSEGIRLMVAYPYWRDLLKFSAGGKLAEMQRVVPFLERELLEYEPDIEKYRSILKERLSLSAGGDPIGSLHAAVSVLGKGISVVAADGMDFRSLFNTFSVESNPRWAGG